MASLIGLGTLFVSCMQKHAQAINTLPMPHVELSRYLGTWYEIARLPNPFERGLSRVTANYSLASNGRLHIFNEGYYSNGEKESINGQGYMPNKLNQGHLRISFVAPYRWFYSSYNILYVNADYTLALVSGSNRDYLWLLSRSPEISEADKQTLLAIARARGFKTDALIWAHEGDTTR